MDPGLKGKLLISETITDIKKIQYYHLNIFKSYENFENLESVAQKLSLPCPFQFWTSNSRSLVNFEVGNMFQNLEENISSFRYYQTFALTLTVSSQFTKTPYFLRNLGHSSQDFMKILQTVA